MFSQESPRIAILGTGGMGKTSLARAILHHPAITARYDQCRTFVACDVASSSVQLAAIIGAHVGLKPGKDLTQPVVRYFSTAPPSLLVLDNLETIWEPKESRGDIEKFLSLLADVDHLALIITMRGAERPANVRWTHPFLEPLKPLTQDAARKTFIDIADDSYALEDIDHVLLLADNMPLAIDLIANLVDHEGVSAVVNRWETERTSLLSMGNDKGSNLDLSISASLASSRLISLPQSQELLSLLSILPDGISNTELVQSNLPIDNILACKAMLLRTSLAYTDDQQRLKALGPIRDYVYKMHPPALSVVHPLVQYLHKLLEIHETYDWSPEIIARLTINFGNIHPLLVHSLTKDNPELVNTIYCTCHFDSLSRQIGRGSIQAITQITDLLPHPYDHRLEVYFASELLLGWRYHPLPDTHHLMDFVDRALGHFPHFDDSDPKCKFYIIIADLYRVYFNDIPKAMHFIEAGLSLAVSAKNTRRQSQCFGSLAWIKWTTGDYTTAQKFAYEAQRLAKISANLDAEVRALRIESGCCIALGHYDYSMSLSKRARDILCGCGMSGGELDNELMSDQANVHFSKSEYAEARQIRKEILPKIEQDAQSLAFELLNIAQIDVQTDASKHFVQSNIDTAKSLFNTTSNSITMVYCDIERAILARREGDFEEAMGIFQQCLKFAWGKDVEAVTHCLEGLSDIHQWRPGNQPCSMWPVTFLVYTHQKQKKLEIHKA
ncbi:hypothetical protein FB451DRAFT_1093357, partial [Mycena latifolia]